MVHIAIPEPAPAPPLRQRSHRLQPAFPAAVPACAPRRGGPQRSPSRSTNLPSASPKSLSTVHGILLPGSGADVDPQKYGEARLPACGPSDPARAAVDELLLQDAFNLHKPILAICHGAQALNVWCNGTLYQDLPTQLGAGLRGVDHAPGREVIEAHRIEITPRTRLARLVPDHDICVEEIRVRAEKVRAEKALAGIASTEQEAPAFRPPHLVHDYPGHILVNSSHHQAILAPGDKLTVSAISPEDGVIEAVELASHAHWVVGVQWHPERTYDASAFSRNIFAAFVQAATTWTPRRIEESVLHA